MERKHLVYFHPDKKNGYGACYEDRWPKRLKNQNLDVEKGVVIKRGLTLEEASELERELQQRDGYPLDPSPYSQMVAVAKIGHKASNTPENRAKRTRNTPYKLIGEMASKRLKGKFNPKLNNQKVWDKRGLACRKPIVQLTLDGELVKEWSGAVEAREVYGDSITTNLRGVTKSAYGYVWKYVEK